MTTVKLNLEGVCEWAAFGQDNKGRGFLPKVTVEDACLAADLFQVCFVKAAIWEIHFQKGDPRRGDGKSSAACAEPCKWYENGLVWILKYVILDLSFK